MAGAPENTNARCHTRYKTAICFCRECRSRQRSTRLFVAGDGSSAVDALKRHGGAVTAEPCPAIRILKGLKTKAKRCRTSIESHIADGCRRASSEKRDGVESWPVVEGRSSTHSRVIHADEGRCKRGTINLAASRSRNIHTTDFEHATTTTSNHPATTSQWFSSFIRVPNRTFRSSSGSRSRLSAPEAA